MDSLPESSERFKLSAQLDAALSAREDRAWTFLDPPRQPIGFITPEDKGKKTQARRKM
jgi:hypothetical protein